LLKKGEEENQVVTAEDTQDKAIISEANNALDKWFLQQKSRMQRSNRRRQHSPEAEDSPLANSPAPEINISYT
jgi:hypothetical protein